jgi:hypothetical protein
MLIALALALAAATLALSPVTLAVRVAPGISATTVAIALDEAAAIWRGPGVALVWEFTRAGAAAGPTHGPCARVDVVFENDATATAFGPMPLGWIAFDALDDPAREIHLSYGNAMTLMQESYGMTIANQMTIYQRDILLGRALGRALAHELGHYLFRSKDHTKTGLMQAHQSAPDFFSPYPSRFQVNATQKKLIASRLIPSPGRPSTTQD